MTTTTTTANATATTTTTTANATTATTTLSTREAQVFAITNACDIRPFEPCKISFSDLRGERELYTHSIPEEAKGFLATQTWAWLHIPEPVRRLCEKQARGTYQWALLIGLERWSGSSLKGRAREYSARYRKSREALIARCNAALEADGWGMWLETRLLKQTEHRVEMRRLVLTDGVKWLLW